MIEFSFDPTLHARVAVYSGTVDDTELLGTYNALISSPGYDASLNDLVDLRAVEKLDVTGDALRELARAFALVVDRRRYRTRRAIVAPMDHVYGMARMYEILRSDAPEEIRVFRDMEAARAWLGAMASRGSPWVGTGADPAA